MICWDGKVGGWISGWGSLMSEVEKLLFTCGWQAIGVVLVKQLNR